MIYGNAAWGLRETPLEEQLKITKNMGLGVLELGIANAPKDIPLNVTEKELADIAAMSEKYGVKLICAATGNDFTTGTEDIAKIKRVIDICKTLKIPNLRIFAGFTPLENMTEEIFEMMISSLRTACVYAEKHGVIPVIETHGAVEAYDDGVRHIMSATTDAETLKKIMNQLPDSAGICFDPANLYAVGIEKPETVYAQFKDRVVYAHFKDFKKLASGHLAPSFCGDGDMDWCGILRAMENFGGVSLFEYENPCDVEDGLLKSYENITEYERNI